MIFNDENNEIETIEAFYIIRKNSRDTYIKIISKDGKRIIFSFNDSDFDPRKMEKGKKTDIKKYIYWDITLVTKETHYLFDITKDIVNLTRTDDNLYNIEVHVENPDMIYSPSVENASFKNLIINHDFSFVYEEKVNS